MKFSIREGDGRGEVLLIWKGKKFSAQCGDFGGLSREEAFGLRDWTPAYPELLFGWSKPSWNSALRQGAVAPTTAGVGKVTRVSKSVIHSKSSSRRLDSKG